MPNKIRPLWVILATVSIAVGAHAKAPKGDYTLIFVGGAHGDETSPTLDRLKQRLQSVDPAAGVVVFTGNYAGGELPEEGTSGRAAAERAVMAHVAATKAFADRGGKVYFLPGHRDFAAGGTKAVRRLSAFLNAAYKSKVDVMPRAACGDPTVVELTGELGLVLINSQWWMQNWTTDPLANQGCGVMTREGFGVYLRDAFNEYRTRRMVIASHHPLETYGEMGDAFVAQSHLKPAPVVGTIGVLASEAGLVPQNLNHPTVRAYVKLLCDEAQRYGAFFFASGHDASLQAIHVASQLQLISGTSGRTAAGVAGARKDDFSASVPGWAELVITPSGGGTARLIAGESGERLFEEALSDVEPFAPPPKEPPPPLPVGPVTTTFSKLGGKKMGSLSKFFLGSFYSDAYSLELPYEVLDLSTEQGGLTPLKTGGSFQTNSLHVRDAQGQDWAMRATTKDSSRFLGKKEGSSGGTVSHAFTAIHPEAALVVPTLAKALGLLHAEPRLMYVPDQDGLGKYRGYINNEIVQLERSPREPKKGVLPETIGGPVSPHGETKFRDTGEAIEKFEENPAKHRLDQEEFLRARLLDMLLGDWDRHQGQWRYAAIPNADGTKTYRPIPRDRDQVFANYNGLALTVARISAMQPRQLQPFNSSYGSLPWLNFGARDLDPIFLNRLTRDRWLEIATEVKAALTDAVIDEAFKTWHPESYALDGERIAADLKIRRDQLVDVADQFFYLVNRNAEVIGSRKADAFELTFEDDGAVQVAIAQLGSGKEPWFSRRYEPKQTAQLRIFALDGDDVLTVRGTPHRTIDIRFVGGDGDDLVRAESGPVKAPAIMFYDAENGARIDPSIAVSDERTNLARFNQYDRTEGHDLSGGIFIPGLAANPDDGLLIGGSYMRLSHGFKKVPFAARHEVIGRFATATLGAAIDYQGLFPQSLEQLDQLLEVSLKTPTWTRNFFGFTNEYVDDGEPLDYYRVRQSAVEARYGLAYGFGGSRSQVGAQVTGQAFITDATPGRFVSGSPETAAALGLRGFLGTRLFGRTRTYDSDSMPTKGIGLSGSIESRFDPAKGTELSMSYKIGASAAIPFDRARRIVWLTRASLEGIVGNHAFYFSPTLGAGELRAYHRQQLSGDVAFAHTNDLRVAVFRSDGVMPGTIGVTASVDHGRVFGPQINSRTYHLSLGGSLWWSIMDTVAISAGYYRGLDGGSRFILNVGPLFAPEL